MAYSQQQPVWATQPLPSGWEAKYDSAQRRYFFINHTTHGTTWEDPRRTAWEQSQYQGHQTQKLTPGWGTLSSSGEGSGRSTTPRRSPSPNRHHESIAMSHSPKNWQKHVEDKYGMTIQHIKPDDENETSFSNQASPVVMSRLKHEYPSADPDIIEAILSSVSNDESRAKHELRSLGYHATHSHHHRDTSPRPSPSGHKQHRTTPHKPAAPAPPPGPSETQKAMLKTKMIKEFSNCSASVVEMALDASHYDETKTRILLQSMGAGSTKTSRESSPSKIKTSTSPFKKMSTTPDVTYPTTSTSGSTTVSPAKPSVPVSSFATNFGSVSAVSTGSTPSSRKDPISRKPAPTRKKTRVPVKKEVRSAGQYTSEFRTEPTGPNTGLAKGPDLDNILDNYVKAKGSDPANKQGPQGASGRDYGLAKGPNRNLLCGPSHSRVQRIQSSSSNFHVDHSAFVTSL